MDQVINAEFNSFYGGTGNYNYFNERRTEQFFVQKNRYIDPISVWEKFLHSITTRSTFGSYDLINLSGYSIIEENLGLEEKVAEIINFIEKQKIIFLENRKDFDNCLKNLSVEEIESLHDFLVNIVNFLNNNKRKATIYVHDDQICIYILFKSNESTYKIDEIINKIYDLLEQKEVFAFVNIGEEFEE